MFLNNNTIKAYFVSGLIVWLQMALFYFESIISHHRERGLSGAQRLSWTNLRWNRKTKEGWNRNWWSAFWHWVVCTIYKFIFQWLIKIVWIPFRVAHLKKDTAVDSQIRYWWKQRKSNLTCCYYNYRFCCSDWKFLALVYDLKVASSKYFCIWCYCSKEEINNFDNKCSHYFWSMINIEDTD